MVRVASHLTFKNNEQQILVKNISGNLLLLFFFNLSNVLGLKQHLHFISYCHPRK